MKKNLNKVVAMAMAMTMVGSTVAFAEEIPTTPAANPDLAITEDASIAGDFIVQTGIVEVVEAADDNGNIEIFISNETGGLRFVVAPETRIVDRVDSQYVTVEDLTEGMTVAVVYSAYAPMGMSFPPFLGAPTGIIANADQGNIAVARFNDDLTSDALQLQLNIGEETMLTRLDGARMAVMPEMLKDGNAIVFYGMTTRSIPAQASPETVFFLPIDEVEIGTDPNFEVGVMPIEAVASPVAEPVAEIPVAPVYIPVREVAEGQGFEVVWQGANAPILVKKAGTTIEITIDSADYKVNGTTKTADKKASLINGTLHASDVVLLG
ncbi:MAG: copper amine oxidase N-terminal domain-containing protein [Bacillota bacterium]